MGLFEYEPTTNQYDMEDYFVFTPDPLSIVEEEDNNQLSFFKLWDS
jgi:hypothetical protein